MIAKGDTTRFLSFKINMDAKFLGMRSNLGVMEME